MRKLQKLCLQCDSRIQNTTPTMFKIYKRMCITVPWSGRRRRGLLHIELYVRELARKKHSHMLAGLSLDGEIRGD